MGKHELVTQDSLAPTAKVLAGWVTGSGATIVLAILAAASDAVPANAFWGGLAVSILSGVAAYIKRSRRADADT